MILFALPFQAVVQESSPCRQTCAFHGVALAQLCIWAGNSTLAFVGGICTCVKCSTQETACLSSLEEGVVTAAFLSSLACSSWRKRASLLLVRASLCSGRVCGGNNAVASRGSSRSEHCPCWPAPLSWRRVLTVPHTHLCSRKAGVSVPRLASQCCSQRPFPPGPLVCPLQWLPSLSAPPSSQ